MARNMDKWTWETIWSIRARCEDPGVKLKWDFAIGFYIPEDGSPIKIFRPLDNYLRECSVSELVDFLSGAPLPIVKLYFHLLPIPQAKKLLNHFRSRDIDSLKHAYNHPQQLGTGAPIIDGTYTTEKHG